MRKKQINDSLEFEISFFEKLVKDNPDFTDALIPLAHAYTLAGEYEKGLAIDQKLALLKKDDHTVFYNLACSYALLNSKNQALEALRRAVSLGYSDRLHMQRDSDLDNIKQEPEFKEIVKELKMARNNGNMS